MMVRYTVFPFRPGRFSASASTRPSSTWKNTLLKAHTRVNSVTRSMPGVVNTVQKFASPTQAVLHHVLPQALPGILTGTIIGMARALGETAPLLMIGMVAFIADLPSGPSDPSTVLPVQIFLWNDAPERAFVARTSLGIVVLLGFLVAMNAAAVWVRSRFETRY